MSWLVCPANGGEVPIADSSHCGRNNYHMILGDFGLNGEGNLSRNPHGLGIGRTEDVTHPSSGQARAIFGMKNVFGTFGAVSDGLSNTFAFSERLGLTTSRSGYDPSEPGRGYAGAGNAWARNINPNADGSGGQYRIQCITASRVAHTIEMNSPGLQWTSGNPMLNGLTMIMPPNMASCTRVHDDATPPVAQGQWNGDHIHVNTPSSNHPGGVNVAIGDGSVQFISDTINSVSPEFTDGSVIIKSSNNAEYSSPSHWGIWGMMSTAHAGESASL